MNALAGLLHLLALVLVVSGVQKLIEPTPAGRALDDAGLVPARLRTPGRLRTAGLAIGTAEITVGGAALAWPSVVAVVALGALYLAFAAFVVRLRSHDATAGCGCFGASSAPPTRLHLALNLASAVVAAVVAVAGAPDIVEVADEGVAVVAAYLVVLATGAGLVLAAPSLLAELHRVGGAADAGRSLEGVPRL